MLRSAIALCLLVGCFAELAEDHFVFEKNVLTPPYFNIATGKKIDASATCGTGGPELFCKLTGGTNFEFSDGLHQGQVCDVCNANNPAKAHPVKYAIDGTEKWWQSPPLSRGSEYNKVNVTINLGQVFHVAYVLIKFANSPRAGTWVLERSSDHGKTFQPWQYFANTDSDCYNLFGMDSLEEITRDDSVICTADYSGVVPLENGEVIVSMVKGRPGSHNFSYATVLQEWSKATDIRLRFLRTKTLLGHLMAVSEQDTTVTRRYYYSIKDISIGGRCVCNGHADTCESDEYDQYTLKCRCRHNTCGDSCEYCCPGFEQKAWRAAVPESTNECEACNCHGHSSSCRYDADIAQRRLSLDLQGNYEGGGVCINCTHNTAGINCEQCSTGYWRPFSVNPKDPNGCRPCDCNSAYTLGSCEPNTGRCYCKVQYAGDRCDRCAPGYYQFPECRPCDCYYNGTLNEVCLPVNDEACPCRYNFAGKYCTECAPGFFNFPECQVCDCHEDGVASDVCDQFTGECPCVDGYAGAMCDRCANGYFNYPLCQRCVCSDVGTTTEVCDAQTGECFCSEKYSGLSCDDCKAGYYGFPLCQECQCTDPGSLDNACDPRSGHCVCKPNYQGDRCDKCAPEYYGYPNCIDCACNLHGSLKTTCDPVTGKCLCEDNINGQRCDECSPEYFNFPRCEECSCDVRGIVSVVPGVCLAFSTGQCECKDNVMGKNCDMCKPLHYDLERGCVSCNCFIQGTLDGVGECDREDGQCWCRPYTCTQRCSQCEDGFFGLEELNYLGCTSCQCDVGGAMASQCDKNDGQCQCKAGIGGRRCTRALDGFFYPTLYQYQYELEDGQTPDSTILRYGFNNTIFPDYSMNGYAEFSVVQRKVIVPVTIYNGGLYRLMFRYVNAGSAATRVNVTVTPNSASGTDQSIPVNFDISNNPRILTVSNPPVLLNRGAWTVVIEAQPGLLIDYLVLLPSNFYEPGILQLSATSPCIPTLTATEKECVMFTHLNLANFNPIDLNSNVDKSRRFSPSTAHPDMVRIDATGANPEHSSLLTEINLPRAGKYALVLEYSSNVNRMQRARLSVTDGATNSYNSKFNIYACQYSFLCRQVALGVLNDVQVFDMSLPVMRVTIDSESGDTFYVKSLTAIPLEDWTMEFVEPKARCITLTGPEFDQCIATSYKVPLGSSQFLPPQSSADINGEQPPIDRPDTIRDENVDLVYLDDADENANKQTTLQIPMDLKPGRYVFLVQYYNPDFTSFAPRVVIDSGVASTGSANVTYCPFSEGCRGVVTTDDGRVVIDVTVPTTTFTMSVPEGKAFWVQYVLVVPEENYHRSLLNIVPIDKSSDFIRQCSDGQDFYRTLNNPSEFCRESIFSLTVDYNDGGLSCNCSGAGTIGGGDAVCTEYGGQCPCKPDVIGRQCIRCKTGFYGYPDCKPCDCNGALCDKDNGDCICPPNTVAPGCNICAPFTHSFSPVAGCEDCECEVEGVINVNDTGCDPNNGQCNCKEHVAGHKCDKCVPGYFGFPNCQKCVCDERGSASHGCDSQTGQCICKENVEGLQCDRCKEGTIYLDMENPQGCTKCFCFGVGTGCSQSQYPFTEIYDMEGWRLIGLVDDPAVVSTNNGQTINVDVDLYGGQKEPSKPNLYWAAPRSYSGDLVGSYGGELRYTSTDSKGGRGDSDAGGSFEIAAPLLGNIPDVILKGNNWEIGWFNPDRSTTVRLKLIEENFQYVDTGVQVKRPDMMMVLADLRAVHIRASPDINIRSVSLDNVVMTTTDYFLPIGSAPAIPGVEECSCPPEYVGHSCQECSSGHYRKENGPNLGFCLPCNCYPNCISCDVSGNLKQNDSCLHNTAGPDCGICKDGYIKNTTSGKIESCQPCPCPFPDVDGNYADTCEELDGELICHCQPGYAGERCELCASGYFGNPAIRGGSCQPCNCHGNLDPNLIMEICDPFTGACSDCMFHTGGKYCEHCADGYFGDAIISKNCTACSCNSCGTAVCDHIMGYCSCQTNVIGKLCDTCKPGFYNFQTCTGCQGCDCAEGALNSQCNIITGQCQCAPNIVGKACDRCAPGFYDYSAMGCKPCQCHNNGPCNPKNGQCECPPGITGKQCDQCKLKRHILPPGQEMCAKCGTCTDDLLDDIEPLTMRVVRTISELKNVSLGVYAYRRLDNLNELVSTAMNNLELDEGLISADVTNVHDLLNGDLSTVMSGSGENTNEMSGASSIELGELTSSPVKELDNEIAKIENAVSQMCNHTDVLISRVRSTENRTMNALTNARDLDVLSSEFLFETKDLLQKLSKEASSDSDDYAQKLLDAEAVLKTMRERNFYPMQKIADNELALARELLDQMMLDFTYPAKNASASVDAISNDLNTTHNKLKDLRAKMNNATDQINGASTANAVNSKNLTKLRNLINNINSDAAMGTDLLGDADQLLNTTQSSVNGPIRRGIDELGILQDGLAQEMDDLRPFYEKLQKDLQTVIPIANESLAKAEQLAEDAAALQRIIENDVDAQDAANAYQRIVIAMTKAANAADEALQAAIQAEANVAGQNLEVEAQIAENKSSIVLSDTEDLRLKDLAKLQQNILDTNENLTHMETQRNDLKDEHATIVKKLAALNRGSIEATSNETVTIAGHASNLADEANKQAHDLEEQIRNAPDPNVDLARELELVRSTMASLPDITDAEQQTNELMAEAQRLQKLEVDFSMVQKIQDIQKKIALTRNVANSVRSSVKFQSGRTPPEYVELRTPVTVVKTEDALTAEFLVHLDAADADNSLMFIGDAKSSDGDYMAVETKGGIVNYHFKVGNGVGTLTSDNIINTAAWHKITIKRRGNEGTLIVEYPTEPGRGDGSAAASTNAEQKSARTNGTNLISSMAAREIDFYLGGLPRPAPAAIQNTQADACISNVRLNNESVGIWNFKSYNGPKPGRNCISGPNGLLAEKPTDNGPSSLKEGNVRWRFRGFGSYLRIAREQTPFLNKEVVPAHFIGFTIDTLQDNSLLFLVGESTDQFMALEIVNGKFKMSWNFGFANGPMSSVVDNVPDITQSNDVIIRAGVAPMHKVIVMSVDLELKLQTKFPMDSKINITGDVYIGGMWQNNKNPAFREVLDNFDISYRGCLDSLNFNALNFDIQDATENIGVTRGCEKEDAQNLKLQGTDYIMSDSGMLNAELDGTVVIKSDHPNGYILTSKDVENNNQASLFLRNGKVVLARNEFELETRLFYADGRSHMIQFSTSPFGFVLNIDNSENLAKEDIEEEVSKRKRRQLDIISNVKLYIGGGDNLPMFQGCIGDIYLQNDPLYPASLIAQIKCGKSGTECVGRPMFNGCNAGNFSTVEGLTGIYGAQQEGAHILVGDETRSANSLRPIEVPVGLIRSEGFYGECSLPYRPVTTGYRYVGDGYSKYYVKLFNPHNWRFTLSMRTTERKGLLFFMSDGRCNEHISLYLVKGKLTFSVMFDEERSRLKSINRYDDGEWHEVIIERKGNKTQLMLDGSIEGMGLMFAESQTFPVNMPFYVGGLHAVPKLIVANHINRKHLADFTGCIRNFQVNNQLADSLGTGSGLRINVSPCFEGGIEPGMYIPYQEEGYPSAYMIGMRSYTLGTVKEITMQIKPRMRDGLIIAVAGTTGDFFNVALIDGDLTVRLRQSGETLFTRYSAYNYGSSLCDGGWHTIRIHKAKNVLALIVDENLVIPVEEGDLQNHYCNTDGHLYIGGIPEWETVDGLLTNVQFTGCIRMLRFENNPINPMTAFSVHGDITTNSCPLA